MAGRIVVERGLKIKMSGEEGDGSGRRRGENIIVR